MSYNVRLRLQAKQGNGAENVGLTFTQEPSPNPSDSTSIALTMAVPSTTASVFDVGAAYTMWLEPVDTTGDEAPAGERLAD